MDKKYFNDVLGLSCIENYLLGILDYSGFETSYLFYDSYITLGELADCFIRNGMKYEYFTGIKRLQSVAVRHGFISFETIKNDSYEEVYNLVQNTKINENGKEFVLVRAHKDFIFKKFNYKNWREDHYVFVCFEDNMLHCLNESTKSEIILTEEDFKDLYNGDYISIKILRNIFRGDREGFFAHFRNSIKSGLDENLKNIFQGFKDLSVLRDLLLVYRTTRKRAVRFLKNYGQADIKLDLLDKYIFQVEYMKAKNNFNEDICGDIGKALCEFEKIFLGGIYDGFNCED